MGATSGGGLSICETTGELCIRRYYLGTSERSYGRGYVYVPQFLQLFSCMSDTCIIASTVIILSSLGKLKMNVLGSQRACVSALLPTPRGSAQC